MTIQIYQAVTDCSWQKVIDLDFVLDFSNLGIDWKLKFPLGFLPGIYFTMLP